MSDRGSRTAAIVDGGIGDKGSKLLLPTTPAVGAVGILVAAAGCCCGLLLLFDSAEGTTVVADADGVTGRLSAGVLVVGSLLSPSSLLLVLLFLLLLASVAAVVKFRWVDDPEARANGE